MHYELRMAFAAISRCPTRVDPTGGGAHRSSSSRGEAGAAPSRRCLWSRPSCCARGRSDDGDREPVRELAERTSNGTLTRLFWLQGTRELWVEVYEPECASLTGQGSL